MSITYTPTTNFGSKDALPSNDPAKVIKGAEFSTEFTAIQSAFTLAAPASSPTFTGTASFAAVSITNDLTVDTNTFHVDSTSNNVGIGTASPSAKLDVFAGADERLKITTIGSNLGFVSTNAADSAYQPVEFQASSFAFTQGNVGIGTTTPDNTFHVVKGAEGEVAQFTGAVENRGLSIRSETAVDASALVVLNTQSGGAAGQLSIETDGNERLRIDESGNVGIGTDAPDTLLEVSSNAPTLRVTNSTNKTWTAGEAVTNLSFYGSDTSQPQEVAFINTVAGSNSAIVTGELSLGTSAGTGAATERMRIDDSGNVGIGTDTPSAVGTKTTLDVGNDANGGAVRVGDATTNMFIDCDTAGGTRVRANSGAMLLGTNAAEDLSIITSSETRMTIDNTGDLYVGATTGTGFNGRVVVSDGAVGGQTFIDIANGSNNNQFMKLGISNNSGIVAVDDGDDLIFGQMTDASQTSLGTEFGRFDTSGNLLLGVTSTSSPTTAEGIKLYPDGRGFFISDAASATGLFARSTNGRSLQFYVSGADAGGINITSGGTPALSAASDERLKDNIVDHESELANVMALRPARWDWKDAERGSGEGFIAQELEQTAWADLVSEGDNGYKQVSGLGAVETRLIKAIQEQQEMIESLKAEVEALKNA